MAIVRATALLALFAGCGGDDDETKPTTDAGGTDGGGMDGGSDAGRDGGAMDGSMPPTDAQVADAGDGGLTLTQALDPSGVNTSRRRAELVLPMFCTRYTACADAGISSGACVQASLAEYEALIQSDTEACIDGTLDFSACIGSKTSCIAVAECGALEEARDVKCGKDAGTSNAN